ncbi:MAG: hypothetical protein HY297_05360 [Thaumarchaeota archaeon]|nr:hypothetical protein [Nitrososphaerota archaeon]
MSKPKFPNGGASKDSGFDPRSLNENREIRYERAAYFGLSFPSRAVRIVENAKNHSPRLPTSCDVCQKMIKSYPFIAKHHISYRKYHITCALRVGLVLPILGKV